MLVLSRQAVSLLGSLKRYRCWARAKKSDALTSSDDGFFVFV